MFCFYYIKTEHDIKTEQVIFPRRIKDPDEVDDQKVEHIPFLSYVFPVSPLLTGR
jgi:hypothetical protein